jgi:hypothetical protein
MEFLILGIFVLLLTVPTWIKAVNYIWDKQDKYWDK